MTIQETNINKARKICDKYATDRYTIDDCCMSEGVPYATFYCWITPTRTGHIKEVQELYKKACEERDESRKITLRERKLRIGEKALVSLEKKIEGWKWEEVTKEGKDKVNGKAVKVVEKFQIPDTAAIIFAATNAFPEEYKNKHNTDITTDGKPIIDKIEVEIMRSSDIEEFKDNGNT